MERLSDAAEAVGAALTVALRELAEKVRHTITIFSLYPFQSSPSLIVTRIESSV